uniref:Uncharacterized protein n=1 Tax=Leersia perrieri TaxID=77586 RepID=A0A0D9WK67_9ORYZ
MAAVARSGFATFGIFNVSISVCSWLCVASFLPSPLVSPPALIRIFDMFDGGGSAVSKANEERRLKKLDNAEKNKTVPD